MKNIDYDTKIYDTIRTRYNFSRTCCRNFTIDELVKKETQEKIVS